MKPSFRRSAQEFATYLSSVLTRTISPHQGLICLFIGPEQGLIQFPNRYAGLPNGCSIRVFQRIGPHPDEKSKVTTLEYSYAYVLGADPETDWIVRYDYVPEEASNPGYLYPISHMHINAQATQYDNMIGISRKKPLERVHFPTDRITLEDFIKHLIVEFEVPLPNNDQAAAIGLLEQSRTVFLEQKRTKD